MVKSSRLRNCGFSSEQKLSNSKMFTEAAQAALRVVFFSAKVASCCAQRGQLAVAFAQPDGLIKSLSGRPYFAP